MIYNNTKRNTSCLEKICLVIYIDDGENKGVRVSLGLRGCISKMLTSHGFHIDRFSYYSK